MMSNDNIYKYSSTMQLRVLIIKKKSLFLEITENVINLIIFQGFGPVLGELP